MANVTSYREFVSADMPHKTRIIIDPKSSDEVRFKDLATVQELTAGMPGCIAAIDTEGNVCVGFQNHRDRARFDEAYFGDTKGRNTYTIRFAPEHDNNRFRDSLVAVIQDTLGYAGAPYEFNISSTKRLGVAFGTSAHFRKFEELACSGALTAEAMRRIQQPGSRRRVVNFNSGCAEPLAV